MGVKTDELHLKGYEVHGKIGSGGFGDVYRARQTILERDVAIKVILAEHASQPDFIRRFETEAQLVARLEHLHIVPLYDYWREPGGAYLIMRLLQGGSLSDLLRQGSPDLQTAIRIFEQIASALAFAHDQRIIHRDIKPGNILLDTDQNAFLSDFGIAKVVTGKTTDGDDGFTGSLQYVAPEQLKSQPTTPQTDIYALGFVLYEMLTGGYPFPDTTPSELVYKHLETPLPDLHKDGLPEQVSEVIQQATAKDPAERFGDVVQFLSALHSGLRATSQPVEIKAATLIDPLTDRELEVLQLMADGLRNREIGEKLTIALSTVKWYVRQIYSKLGVSRRREAIAMATRLGLLKTETPLPDGVLAAAMPIAENPYRGLRAFQQADVHVFFGREALTEQLVETMAAHRFMAVVGPSGSGKSSVVRAGLLPSLRNGAIHDSENWYITDMMPGAHPLDELEVALRRIAARDAGDLMEQLQRDERGLIRATRLILPEDDGQLLLLVDQFEELFTLTSDRDEAQHVMSLLATAATEPRSPVRIVITLRADFYDRPLLHPAFGQLLRSHTEVVIPLTPEELEQTIVRPAEQSGVTVERGLVAALVAAVTEQPGSLPLLEYALTELYDRREGRLMTLAQYQVIGGVAGSLAHQADEVYDDLSEAGQVAMQQVFLRLVTPGEGTEDVRRRVLRSELLNLREDTEAIEEVLLSAGELRLLTFDYDPETREPTVDVAHEALIREWGRLRAWLDSSRDDIRLQRLLSAAAADWRAHGRDSSYLLTGARLAQFIEWRGTTGVTITQDERVFLDESYLAQEKREEAEAQRQAHEAALERRARRIFQILTVVLLFVALGGFALSAFAIDREQQTQNALVSAQEAEAKARYLALINGAQAAYNSGDPDTGLALAVAANQVEKPSAEAQALLSEIAYAPGVVRVLGEHISLSLDVSADGKLAIGSRRVEPDKPGENVIVWSLDTGDVLHVMEGHEADVLTVGISQDGKTGFSFAEDMTIILWNLETGEMLHRIGEGHILTPAALAATFSPDGRTLLSNNGGLPLMNPDHDAKLLLWDVESGTLIREFIGHTRMIGRLAISPDGKTALSGGWNEELILWDMETGEVIRRRENLNPADWRAAADVAFLPDGKRALVLFLESDAALIDLDTMETIRTYGEGGSGFWGWAEFAVSPDGRWLYLSNPERTGQALWDVETGEIAYQVSQANRRITTGAAFLPDGKSLIVEEDAIIQRQIAYGAEIQQFADFDTEIVFRNFIMSADGRQILVDARDEDSCEFVVLEADTGTVINRYGMDEAPLSETGCPPDRPFITYSPDGQSALYRSIDQQGILWDVNTGDILQRLQDFTVGGVGGITITADGKQAIGTTDNWDGENNNAEIRVWDLETGDLIQRVTPFPGDGGLMVYPAISADGRFALAANGEKAIYVDILNDEIIHEFVTDEGIIAGFISPDGQQGLTVRTGLGEIINWNLDTGERVASWNSGSALFAVFSPDGRYVATTGQHVSLWDVQIGEEIRRYMATGQWRVVQFHPDGESFFVRDTTSNNIRQWRIDEHDTLMAWTLANRLVRELTCDERDQYGIVPLCDPESDEAGQ